MKRGQALRSLPSARVARRVVAGYWVVVLLFVCWAAFLAYRDQTVVPRGDESLLLRDLYLMPFFDWVFSIQHGHRLPLTRLLFAADFSFFEGQKHLLIVSSVILLGLCTVVLWRALRLEGGLDAPLPRLVCGGVTLAIFWSASVFNLLCGVCNANILVLLFALIALACLSHHASRPGRGSRAALTWSLVAGVLATGSMGHGVAIWPALLVLAITARLPLRDITAVAGTALVVGGFFVMGTATDVGSRVDHSPVGAALAHPIDLLRFTVTLLGSAVAESAREVGLLGRATASVSTLIGVAGLVGIASHLAWSWRRPEIRSPQDLLAIGIMTFATTVAFGIGANRLFALGPEQALAPRFFDWSALFWVGAAVAGGAFARRTPDFFWPGTIAVTVATAFLLTALPGLRAPELGHISRAEDAAAAVLVGAAGVYERRHLYPGPADEFEQLSQRLRGERKSFFATRRADWMGRHLDGLFERAASGRCHGEITGGPKLRANPGTSLRGWAWDEQRERAPDSILLVGEDGVIEGLGNVKVAAGSTVFYSAFSSALSSSFSGAFSEQEVKQARWRAWGTRYRAWDQHAVYGVIDDGRSVCHVAGRESPPS